MKEDARTPDLGEIFELKAMSWTAACVSVRVQCAAP